MQIVFLLLAVIGIVATIIGIMIGIILSRRAKHDHKIPWYFRIRDDATQYMLKDMTEASDLVFIGISHVKLYDYLFGVIEKAEVNRRELPFETIKIFFARDDVGTIWEDRKFAENIVVSIERISTLLTNKLCRAVCPKLRQVCFYQTKQNSHYGGSMFTKAREKHKGRFPVMYVVFYACLPELNTETSHTLRIDQRQKWISEISDFLDFLYERYMNSYKCMSDDKNTDILFELDVDNAWDRSVEQWRRFQTKYPIYRNVMNDLCKFGDIDSDHHVLDLGAGLGIASVPPDNVKDGSLTLLDSSPQMIAEARNLFGSYGNVSFVVADARRPLYGLLKGRKFDRIISCFSIQSFVRNRSSLKEFAQNWRDYLNCDGIFLLGIHNSCIKIEDCEQEDFFEWRASEDPLRKHLGKLLGEMGIKSLQQELTHVFTTRLWHFRMILI